MQDRRYQTEGEGAGGRDTAERKNVHILRNFVVIAAAIALVFFLISVFTDLPGSSPGGTGLGQDKTDAPPEDVTRSGPLNR